MEFLLGGHVEEQFLHELQGDLSVTPRACETLARTPGHLPIVCELVGKPSFSIFFNAWLWLKFGYHAEDSIA